MRSPGCHHLGSSALVVDETGGLLGVISERDLVSGLAISGAMFLEARVDQWMTKSPVTCTPDDNVDTLTHTMTVNRFRHLPVMQGGEVTGFISTVTSSSGMVVAFTVSLPNLNLSATEGAASALPIDLADLIRPDPANLALGSNHQLLQ